MDNRSFVTRTLVLGFVIGMLILSTICCVGTFLFLNRPDDTAVEPVVQPTPVVAIQPTAQAVGMATICDYAPNFTSSGQTVVAGTHVRGPAVVKPNRDISWGMPIYFGEEYVTQASDEVIWLFTGDNACVDSQSQFFVHWGKTAPK